MIEAINVSKIFHEREVLKNISVKFEQGKTNLIIGQSGSGKTVLMKCLVGLFQIDKGEIKFDGRSFSTFLMMKKRKYVRKSACCFRAELCSTQ